jgi:hypothetical protein
LKIDGQPFNLTNKWALLAVTGYGSIRFGHKDEEKIVDLLLGGKEESDEEVKTMPEREIVYE